MKSILFLSGIDFKEKSIQVIRKTPEAYANSGWHVDYVVARDSVKNGNYFYEEEINPVGLNVHRLYWPFINVRAKLGRYLGLALTKFSSFIVVLKLALKAKKLLDSRKYDVIYGYEMHGVLAMNILKPFLIKKTKLVSRFQGTFLNEMFVNGQYARIIFNLDLVLAIRLHSDLIIMTNDGTQGDKAVKKIIGNRHYRIIFLPNGVDLLPTDRKNLLGEVEGRKIFMSISRLVGWKRVERNIEIMRALRDSSDVLFHYYIIGEGDRRPLLENLVLRYKLQDQVTFLGAIKHSEISHYLKQADFFLSMYDASNVGNPLLEAIRAQKIIITLNNGDTADWIVHKCNGLIYDYRIVDYNLIASDINEVIKNNVLLEKIKKEIESTSNTRLHTWQERLSLEIEMVDKL